MTRPPKSSKLLFEINNLILLRAQADLFAIVEQMGAVARVDALDKGFLSGVVGVYNHVDTGTVESHGVERGQNTYVAHRGSLSVAVAVAVNRKVVGHVDIENLAVGMVDDGF